MAFTDVTEPTGRLKAPENPADFHSPLKVLNDASDLVSPTYWVNEIIKASTGYNPLDKAKEYLAGDWAAYAKCGEVWESLGKMCADISENINAGNRELDATWDGNAADAAFNYFKALAERCDELQADLSALSTQYGIVSHGVWSTAEGVGAILGQIGDAAATAAISAAAGTLTSWTGWGAAVGYGLAGFEILRIIELWGDATKMINNAQLIVNGAMGVTESVGGELAGKLRDFRLPAEAYDNAVA
ncbi:hypothetical protein [Streptomyces sp. V3I7]|uniref:hypothetical protein n=1 Tax=Streptomyces sp. V3I7 TaxID=3042278 RepID=UPI002784B939|nr:hypothetical protein [Streptomyces sp. V3I7]MDQ0990937.1 hypothetical protein [Streptomyces sp. V3I7]